METLRTPEERFDGLDEFPYESKYLEWSGLKVAHLDEGAADAEPVLMVHGQPTWSFLYRKMIPPLVAAGLRCIAPDHVGFGRSDKVTDEIWYTYERHVERLRHLIETLDLKGITLVVQDWGGPIGLRQAVDMPERFARIIILNTWLHHGDYVYSDGIKLWRQIATDPERGLTMPISRIMRAALKIEGDALEKALVGYEAPFTNQGSRAGARRFPWMLPFVEPEIGGASEQARCHEALKTFTQPKHVIFSDGDMIFTPEHGERWAEEINASFDLVPNAGHFLQEDAGAEIADLMLARIIEERRGA